MSGRHETKPRAVTPAALPTDEQALLVAYRVMDDRARRLTLRMAVSSAVKHPAPAQRGPSLSAMPAAALPLLHDFCWISASAQHDVCCMVAGIAEYEAAEPAKPARQPLRLVVGGRP